MFLSVDYLSRYTVECRLSYREKEKKREREKEIERQIKRKEREFLPGDSLFPKQKNWR